MIQTNVQERQYLKKSVTILLAVLLATTACSVVIAQATNTTNPLTKVD